MRTPRKLETQNRHPIQGAGSAGKVCWFLPQQSKAPREKRERCYLKETMGILSYQESPAQTERQGLEQRQDGKTVFSSSGHSMGGESGAERAATLGPGLAEIMSTFPCSMNKLSLGPDWRQW